MINFESLISLKNQNNLIIRTWESIINWAKHQPHKIPRIKMYNNASRAQLTQY